MNFNQIKKILFSDYARIFFKIIIIFILLDLIFSNLIIKKYVKKNCIKYIRYALKEKTYHSYELEKNCKAYETQRTAKTYDVLTDENGYRISTKKIVDRKKKDNAIVVLGDSYSYGYGLNYEVTTVGLLENKNNNYEFFNLSVPGYSPVILKYKLQQLLQSGIKPKKIIYLMDYTDVYEEANAWIQMKEFEYPVISDKKRYEEVKKNYNFKNNFKISRLLIYNLNKSIRNIKKDINKKKFEADDKIIGSTSWANFTYKPYEELDKKFWSKNNFKVGINNIKTNIKEISEMANMINSEFYIVIYPWPETLEYGEKFFSWQKFGSELCQFTNCTKLINAFPKFNKIKNQFSYWKKEIYILQDLHLNENGHRLLAEIIHRNAF